MEKTFKNICDAATFTITVTTTTAMELEVVEARAAFATARLLSLECDNNDYMAEIETKAQARLWWAEDILGAWEALENARWALDTAKSEKAEKELRAAEEAFAAVAGRA